MLDELTVRIERARPHAGGIPDELSLRGALFAPQIDRPGPREEPPAAILDCLEVVAEPSEEPPAPPLQEVHPGTPPAMITTIFGLKLLQQSEKAVLFARPYGGQAWMPKSAIRFTSPSPWQKHPRVDVTVPVWLFNQVRPKLSPKH